MYTIALFASLSVSCTTEIGTSPLPQVSDTSANNDGDTDSSDDTGRLANPSAPADVLLNINGGATAVEGFDVPLTLRLRATDDDGVQAYLLGEQNATDRSNPTPELTDPSGDDAGWISVAVITDLDIEFAFLPSGTYQPGETLQICAWVRDIDANTSPRACDTIQRTDEPESQFTENWDGGLGYWAATNGVWQVGVPTSGPNDCFSGSMCAATILDGNYPSNTDSRLESPSFELEGVSDGEVIDLRFWQWISYSSSDNGQLQVSAWNDVSQSWGSWIDIDSPVVGVARQWTQRRFDLTAYAGQRIRLGFMHTESNNGLTSISSGWYIDEIQVLRMVPLLTTTFEEGVADWSATNGVWQVGSPTSGPNDCWAGQQCLATDLVTNYPSNTDSRMESAPFVMPTASGFEEVHLRFEHWFSLSSSDTGQVQLSSYNELTGTWSTWVDVGDPTVGVSGGWTTRDIDVTEFQGQRVRLGFMHTESNNGLTSTSSGWYIDDINIVVF